VHADARVAVARLAISLPVVVLHRVCRGVAEEWFALRFLCDYMSKFKFAQVWSVRSVDFNRPVGQSRSISTVGSIAHTGEQGRYRRSV